MRKHKESTSIGLLLRQERESSCKKNKTKLQSWNEEVCYAQKTKLR